MFEIVLKIIAIITDLSIWTEYESVHFINMIWNLIAGVGVLWYD